jgi:hypothetical protein
MKLLEKQVEAMLVKACKTLNIKCIKGWAENNVGFPDRIVFNTKSKQIFYVEVKNETSYKLTPMQKLWLFTITDSGGKYFLINGEKEMETFINTYIRGQNGR